MPEESTTPDLVELVRALVEAGNRRDFDEYMGFFSLDAVWEGQGVRFVGVQEIRALLEEWYGAYEEYEVGVEEVLDLGGGVVLLCGSVTARPGGGTGQMQTREAWVTELAEGLIVRLTAYTDTDEARAAAERLSEERAND